VVAGEAVKGQPDLKGRAPPLDAAAGRAGAGPGFRGAGVRRVTDEILLAAARALADCSPAAAGPEAGLLRALDGIRQVSRRIAGAVGVRA
jgi:hypothetical protein